MVGREKNEKKIQYIPSIEINGVTLKAETQVNSQDGDRIYYARIMPLCGVCMVQNLRVKKITDTYITAIDEKVGTTQLISTKYIGVLLFKYKAEAQKVVDSALAEGKIKTIYKTTSEDEE